jgi:hypothetical protein
MITGQICSPFDDLNGKRYTFNEGQIGNPLYIVVALTIDDEQVGSAQAIEFECASKPTVSETDGAEVYLLTQVVK